MTEVARQLLRALRGGRSQAAFSRRLGYRSKVAADWEQGLRYPSAVEFLRICGVVGVDLEAAMHRFHAPAAASFDPQTPWRWLCVLRGSSSVQEVADRCGRSRYAVGRWLAGRTQPRLPDLLRMVDALTGRVEDLVAALVDIEQVPALRQRVRRAEASRRVGVEEPWTLAVMLALETGVEEERLATALGLAPAEVGRCVDLLEEAGVVSRETGRLVLGGALTIDTQTHPDAGRVLKEHWARVGADRVAAPREGDLLSFNLFACSSADLAHIRALQRGFYREVRSIVAASQRSEVVALLNAQLVTWD